MQLFGNTFKQKWYHSLNQNFTDFFWGGRGAIFFICGRVCYFFLLLSLFKNIFILVHLSVVFCTSSSSISLSSSVLDVLNHGLC